MRQVFSGVLAAPARIAAPVYALHEQCAVQHVLEVRTPVTWRQEPVVVSRSNVVWEAANAFLPCFDAAWGHKDLRCQRSREAFDSGLLEGASSERPLGRLWVEAPSDAHWRCSPFFHPLEVVEIYEERGAGSVYRAFGRDLAFSKAVSIGVSVPDVAACGEYCSQLAVFLVALLSWVVAPVVLAPLLVFWLSRM